MTDSSHVWTPDPGDEIWNLKGAGIFSISLLGEKIRLNVLDNSMRRHGLPGKLYKASDWMTEGMLVDWDHLGARTSLEFYPLCELVSCYLTPSGRCVDPLGTTLEFRLQCELGSWNLRSDNHFNAILVDTVKMAFEIDTEKILNQYLEIEFVGEKDNLIVKIRMSP
ncbi:hypothetical protein AVEN_98563-1 [Araneus ventricosus]|uniref:Uncharacterized protein n=1 Tax=Araneus ventricosus TaxID=182803 RepID=A0A4Y2UJ24_ARAVE|nr:hypothetical protein AVEN_98563-1 [Araneus ventricosus]